MAWDFAVKGAKKVVHESAPILGNDGIHYVNRHGLPSPYVRVVLNDQYSKGESDYSATGLSEPPRASALLEKFKGSPELVVDVSSRVAAIIGHGTHSTAECAARPGVDLCEKRLFAKFEVDGKIYTISAQLDLFETDTGVLYDWKTTKAYAFSKKAGSGKKPEWITQLNIGAELLRRQPEKYEPKALSILAMLKDWKEGDAAHPESEVVAVDLPMWSSEKTVAFMEERIRLQVAARQSLPQCTSAETWGGRKCPKWCDAKSVCEQYKLMLKTGRVSEE